MFYVVIEPSPEGWVCYNVESRAEVERSLSRGGWEMPQADVERLFGEFVSRVSPVNTKVSADGKTVEFTPPTDAELDEEAASAARGNRQRLISATDYLVLPDYPLAEEKKQAVREYRQALRDITAQPGWPRNIVWPEKPSI